MVACANGHYRQCPPSKDKPKEKAMQLSYNIEKNVKSYILACFTRHSGAQDSVASHCPDLGLIRMHLNNDVIFWAK